jgi:hypothetical protein
MHFRGIFGSSTQITSALIVCLVIKDEYLSNNLIKSFLHEKINRLEAQIKTYFGHN